MFFARRHTRPPAGPTLDAVAAMELARARRHGCELTIVTLRLGDLDHGPRPELHAVADELAALLRISDVVGFIGPRRLAAVLPESGPDEARGAILRLRAELDPGLVAALSCGHASYPDDDLTWEGLKRHARRTEAPLALHALPETIAEALDARVRRAGEPRAGGGGR